MKRIFLALFVCLFGLLAGCTSQLPGTPALMVVSLSPSLSRTLTLTPSPAVTIEPTLDQNAILATKQAESLSKFATSKAVSTQRAITPSATPRPISSPTITPTPSLTSTPIADDAFVQEMTEKGYTVTSAGSIQDGQYVYHTYLFREPKENASNRTMDVIQETWIIAFYRWDGQKNDLVGTFYPASWSKREPDNSYPVFYRIINWNDPHRSFLGLEWVYDPDEETRVVAGLKEYASDINHNGRPEFDFVAQYCSVSCSQPAGAYHFFEITATGKVIDLAAGLAGHLDFHPYSIDPVVYEIVERYGYGNFGFFGGVYIPHFYEWQEDRFVEVTLQFKNMILESWDESIAELKAQYGQPFYGIPNETTLVSIPMIYQSLGMGSEGLTLFLEISDLANWPATDSGTTCWLQYSRAYFSTEYASGKPFTLPRSSSAFDPAISSYTLKQELNLIDATQYELTACYALLPDE
jgi:hypothetical protein